MIFLTITVSNALLVRNFLQSLWQCPLWTAS